MTFVFFISIILPDISLAINKSEYLIPILRYTIVTLTSLFAWTLFGVLGRTLGKAVYRKTETESLYCFLFLICLFRKTAPHINMLFLCILSRKTSCKKRKDNNRHRNTE